MPTAVVAVRLVLVGVFALAGIAKLNDFRASRDAVEEFGVSPHFAGIIGTALPFAEVAVAVALVPTTTARWGAIAAAVLLIGFSIGVVRALRRGLAPDCHCFGQVASEPVSARTLMRNGVLLVLAIFAAVAEPRAAISSWTASRTLANSVAAIAVVAVAMLAAVLWARRGTRAENAPTQPARTPRARAEGTPGPEFRLRSLEGRQVSLSSLLSRGRPVVLVFASPLCTPCRALLPHLARWNKAISNEVTLVVIESTWQDHGMPDVEREALDGLITLTEPDRRVAEAYGAPATPCAVALTPDGLLASGPMPGSSQVERLIRDVLQSSASQASAGQPVTAAVSG